MELHVQATFVISFTLIFTLVVGALILFREFNE